jgi:glycosyltransferase involved in cell wall biosynthesis
MNGLVSPILLFLVKSLVLSQIFLLYSSEYPLGYRDIALHENSPVGVLVVAYNRPEYLSQVIASIENNPESTSLPFFFFLDGGPGSAQNENSDLIQRSKIARKGIILRDDNYGCAKNLIDARRFMFDWCQFEKVIVMEDDLIITPQYLGLLIRLHQWAKTKYDNIGPVQAWSYCTLPLKEKRRRLSHVVDSGNSWWSFLNYCVDRETWNLISPILYEYESRFIDAIPKTADFFLQRSKPGYSILAPEIRIWIKELIAHRHPKPVLDQKRQFKCVPLDYESIFSSDTFEPNQDLMTGFALWMAGLIKVQTVVNRAQHIGRTGITINDQTLWEHFGFDKIILDEFQTDANLLNFREVNR